MQVRFIPSDSRFIQAKRDEVYKRYGNEWIVREKEEVMVIGC